VNPLLALKARCHAEFLRTAPRIDLLRDNQVRFGYECLVRDDLVRASESLARARAAGDTADQEFIEGIHSR
ncbi:hypothetical protein PMAYCL1PPCAC_25451, partial [Pristionchus mayeri]